MAKVDKSDPDGCWIWTGGKLMMGGYGLFRFRGGKTVQAHRWTYEHFFGPIPPDKQLNHTCNRPDCVRPEHLYLGTHQENSDDMMRAGRHGKSPAHRLSAQQVESIRDEYRDGGRLQDIAERYGVHPLTIWRITSGRGWQKRTNGEAVKRPRINAAKDPAQLPQEAR